MSHKKLLITLAIVLTYISTFVIDLFIATLLRSSYGRNVVKMFCSVLLNNDRNFFFVKRNRNSR